MAEAHRFILLADLHLSDCAETSPYRALQWAVDFVNRERPDFVAVGGDMVSFGTPVATRRFLEAMERVEVPVYHTPGNAELRSPEAMFLLGHLISRDRRFAVQDDLLVLLPDTSTGTVPEDERVWMDSVVAAHPDLHRRIVITHYPPDKKKDVEREWLTQWLIRNRIELLAVGHSHFHRTRRLDGCVEIMVRGLDPDKAIGDLPGVSLFESEGPGDWSEKFSPWPYPVELLPADLPDAVCPVGWSIHGDPVEAAKETLDLGLSCLEFRPRGLDFSRQSLSEALGRLRDRGPLYLSYHLPNLAWNSDSGRIEGEDQVRANLECALEIGVSSLTVHVPRALAGEMEDVNDGEYRPTGLYGAFEELYARLFHDPAGAGVRIAIENIHNPPRTPQDSPDRKFATRIDEYLRWIETVERGLSDITNAGVGALLDLGHARNNGGDLDNLQPMSEWYARLGRRILGYHAHQVDTNPETGRLGNHREITGLFSRRISLAGFLWAWSARQITRGPLFVEVRGEEARRNTVLRLKRLFEGADRIRVAIDLPDRQQ